MDERTSLQMPRAPEVPLKASQEKIAFQRNLLEGFFPKRQDEKATRTAIKLDAYYNVMRLT